MKTETVEYKAGNVISQGFFAHDSSWKEKRPLILIAPTWQGLHHFAKKKAEEIVRLGYNAFAIDIYGNGKNTPSSDEAAELMMPLFLDRGLIRERMQAAYDKAITLPSVDTSKIGVMGFCFGGLCAIEFFKSGAKLKGIVSFHGVLADELQGKKAKLAKTAENLHGSLLVLHGYRDPMVPLEDVLKLQKEMASKNVDWQTIIYANVGHAFTNPEANDPKNGMCFDPVANHRSILAMANFFQERFE